MTIVINIIGKLVDRSAASSGRLQKNPLKLCKLAFVWGKLRWLMYLQHPPPPLQWVRNGTSQSVIVVCIIYIYILYGDILGFNGENIVGKIHIVAENKAQN